MKIPVFSIDKRRKTYRNYLKLVASNIILLYKLYNKTLVLAIVTGIFLKPNLYPHQMYHNIILIETSDVSNAFEHSQTIVLIQKSEYT